MRKVTGIILALVMTFATILTGCTKVDANNSKEKKMKVGFIYVGPVGDGGFTYSHDEGRKYLEKELKVETKYKESVKEDAAEVEKVCEDFINEGCTVIIGTSFGFMDGMEKSAKNHPEVKYLHCSGYKTAENMSNYFGRMYQARYLSGIVAGLKTKTNKIGYVAAFEIPEVVRGINAFTLGVRSVNANATVSVSWTHTWYDPAKESEAAKYLLNDKGVDVIAQHQDTAGPQQAAEAKGASSIGYNSDMSKTAPKANLTSAVWNWGPFYVEQIKAIQAGTWKSGSIWEPMSADKEKSIVNLAELTPNAPANAKDAVEKAKVEIISGKNKIFVGPLKDNTGVVKVPDGKVMTDAEMLSFDWFVEGVDGKVDKK